MGFEPEVKDCGMMDNESQVEKQPLITSLIRRQFTLLAPYLCKRILCETAKTRHVRARVCGWGGGADACR